MFGLLGRSVAVALAIAGSSGCGADDGSADGGEYSLTRYCTDSAEAFCALNAGCCAGASFDESACRMTVESDCMSRSMREMELGRVFDPSAARTCVQGLDVRYSDCAETIRNTSEYLEVHRACADVWSGTVPEGDPCTSTNDCAPVAGLAVECEPIGSGLEGLCATYPYADGGAPCGLVDGMTYECPVSHYCSSASLCEERRPSGAACEGGHECASLRCIEGICVPDELRCG